MRSSKKKIKDISRSVLNTAKMVFTTEVSVLKFFQIHPDSAFSVNMLYQAGFNINICQILRKLVETDQIIQTSYHDEEIEEEEDLYYLARSKNTFILNKTDEGWIISKITINGFWFDIDCGFLPDKIQDSLAGNMIKVAIGFPSDGDGVILTEIKDPDYNQIDINGANKGNDGGV